MRPYLEYDRRNKMIVCIHHNDADGWCSAAIVRSVFPNCKLIEMSYGHELPFDQINKDDTVYMVDFCLEPIEEMIKLSNMCELIWIDHHASSMKAASGADFHPEGLRVIGKAGCELTWEYLRSGKKIPTAVHFIGRYDVWDHSDPRILPFHYGMILEDLTPSNDILWKKLFDNDEDLLMSVMKRGVICHGYQQAIDMNYAKSHMFDVTVDGLRGLALNVARCSSLAFVDAWDPTKYDIMISFAYLPDSVTVSIYSDKPNVDVSEIAAKYGGGGHINASGFAFKTFNEFLKVVVPVQ